MTLRTNRIELADGSRGVGTDYVIDGSAKAYVYHDISGVSSGDTLNISSVIDNGIGSWSPNLANAMSSTGFVIPVSVDLLQVATRGASVFSRETASKYTVLAFQTHAAGSSESAVDGIHSSVCGDLA